MGTTHNDEQAGCADRAKQFLGSRLFLQESVQDRWEKRPGRLLIETTAHERHRIDRAQAMRQAPAEQLRIPRGQQEPWAADRRCRADQRFQILIRPTDSMAKVPNVCRMACHRAATFHDPRGALRDRGGDFRTAIVTMHVHAQAVAAFKIVAGRTR